MPSHVVESVLHVDVVAHCRDSSQGVLQTTVLSTTYLRKPAPHSLISENDDGPVVLVVPAQRVAIRLQVGGQDGEALLPPGRFTSGSVASPEDYVAVRAAFVEYGVEAKAGKGCGGIIELFGPGRLPWDWRIVHVAFHVVFGSLKSREAGLACLRGLDVFPRDLSIVFHSHV